MPTDLSVQVAVIGAGPGGYAAAFYAADLGMSVALIDPDANPGGVCLYRGCIPSKALLHAAKVITESHEASAFGISFDSPKIDLDKLRSWKDAVVGKLTGGLGQITKMRKITYVRGRAGFRDPHTLDVQLAGGGNQPLSFEHAIIATGSLPSKVPGLSIDSPRVMDSTSALELADVPRKLLVIGGGYIGLELGTVYAALGSEVSVVEMMPGLLPGADRDLVGVLARRAEKVFKAIMLNTKVASLLEEKKGIKVTFEGENLAAREATFDKVLIAVGRRPDAAVPGLDRTRVKLTARGFVETDAARRTAEPSIFAIGDVAGEPMLAHKASHEARAAVDAITGRNAAFEPNAIPAVVFTDPEIAWCGLTETEAQQRGIKVEVARFPWAAIGRAITLDRPDGSTKLVIDPESRRVLGVGIVGAGAGELISEGVLAIEMGALVDDVAMTIHPHPTLSETLMEAAEVYFGHSTHVYRPKRKS
ncbi:MAG TPA: dihydrolipoyl dehydrogenase [Vicinamibacterales bacterium]|nr:dihydrolipoyl dehydrogenase [Vicinamibacterales bacterium]